MAQAPIEEAEREAFLEVARAQEEATLQTAASEEAKHCTTMDVSLLHN
jgi:hypothetical protein